MPQGHIPLGAIHLWGTLSGALFTVCSIHGPKIPIVVSFYLSHLTQIERERGHVRFDPDQIPLPSFLLSTTAMSERGLDRFTAQPTPNQSDSPRDEMGTVPEERRGTFTFHEKVFCHPHSSVQ